MTTSGRRATNYESVMAWSDKHTPPTNRRVVSWLRVQINHVIYAPPPAQRTATCYDKNEKFCQGWAEQGECVVNPLYMDDECRMSCKKC